MTDKWSDLALRVGSGVLLAATGFAAAWIGGPVFFAVVSLVCGLMVWELVRMLDGSGSLLPFQLGLLSALAVFGSVHLPALISVPLLVFPVLIGVTRALTSRVLFVNFCVLILLAGFAMMWVRAEMGFVWLAWLALVVVATDVMGYFAGRILGGPKILPKISPKKTWAGTAGGWVGAALVGAIFSRYADMGFVLVVLSMLISVASQAGDMAESVLKRRVGVKDSSNLIPGHGGLLDRFDGMLGAAIVLLAIDQTVGLPMGPL